MLPSFKSLTPRKILKWTILTATVIIIGTTLSYAIVSINAIGRTYDDTTQIPHRPVALLLGTSPVTRQGEHNNYFDTRIKACAQLYHAGKIDRIIASGGNYQGKQRWGCNELQAMHDSLVCRGIPDSIITRDEDYIDWESLRAQVAASDIKYKETVLVIIDLERRYVDYPGGQHIDHRITKLKNLAGGSTWNELYKRYFKGFGRKRSN